MDGETAFPAPGPAATDDFPFNEQDGRIETVDGATAGWGHIVAGHLFQPDQPAASASNRN